MELRTAVGDAGVRVRAGAWGAAQCGLAASGAWAFSTEVLHHLRPFFASVAAVVALGLSGGGRLRRTAELAVGVAIGVAVGDLLVGLIGQGAWQIGVVVFVGLLLAVAVGGRGLVVSQAGLQAVFVVALPRLPHSGLHRWQDAIVGGATALLVAALLPQDPWRQVVRLRCGYVAELAAVLRDTSAGVRTGSATAAAEALARGRALEPALTRWDEALAAGRD
ncbi:MAG: FUSC family protein, partial [Mycobacteriales bacterium]